MADSVDAILARYAPAATPSAAPVSDVDSILTRYGQADPAPAAAPLGLGAAELAGGGQAATPDVGLLESVGRGVAQGLTFNFADEIEAGLRSLNPGAKYSEQIEAVRGKYRAASDAHPIGSGLGEVIGGVLGSGLTGGATGALGLAGKGAAGVAKIAATEGALSGLGASEAKDAVGLARDAASSGAAGGVIGYGLGRVIGKYLGEAPERHTMNVVKDLTEGATPTEAKRFARGAGDLVTDVLEKDKVFMRAATNHGAKDAAEVAQQRLSRLSDEVSPIYRDIDKATGGVPLAKLKAHFDEIVTGLAKQPGNEGATGVLEEVRDNALKAWAGKDQVPTQDVRRWVTKLLKLQSKQLGSLNETAAYELKTVAHDAASEFLRNHLDDLRASHPSLAPSLDKLAEANKRIRAYAQAESLMEHAADRAQWKRASLLDTLRNYGVPGIGAIVGSGGHALGGALGAATGKALVVGGRAVNKATTRAAAALVRAARSGDVTAQMVQDAINAGVPSATVQGVLGTWRNRPDALRSSEKSGS